jgi:hypothetical protein
MRQKTGNGNSAYSVIQSYRQYCKFSVSHSYILEQPTSAAPRKWVHLCPAHGIDWPSFHMAWLCYPPHTPLAWLGFLGLACPDFYCWFVHSGPFPQITHMYKFSYSYHMRPKLLYTYTTLWAHDTFHIHTYQFWFLSLFFLAVTRQAGWPRPLMSGTVPTDLKIYIFCQMKLILSSKKYVCKCTFRCTWTYTWICTRACALMSMYLYYSTLTCKFRCAWTCTCTCA